MLLSQKVCFYDLKEVIKNLHTNLKARRFIILLMIMKNGKPYLTIVLIK